MRKIILIGTIVLIVVGVIATTVVLKHRFTDEESVVITTSAEEPTEVTTEQITITTTTTTTETTTKVESNIYYDIPLSYAEQDLVKLCCKKYSLEPKMVYAVMKVESNFNCNARSDSSYGIMQINICNHSRYCLEDPYNYSQNVTVGVRILGELMGKYQDDHKVLMAYNLGEGGASALWNQGIVTSRYSEKVISYMDNMQVKEELIYD